MRPGINESVVEAAAVEVFRELGYAHATDAVIGPDGSAPERASHGEVILAGRLEAALARLNPSLPPEARAEALARVLGVGSPNLAEENRRLHRLMVDGVDVEFHAGDGTLRGEKARLVAFDDPGANDWLVVQQLTVIEGGVERRADLVAYLNGLPVGVLELKNPGDGNATLRAAWNQLQTYKAEVPGLFRTNACLVTSDGVGARIGSLTAAEDRFMPWRTVDGGAIPKGAPELDTLIRGVFGPARFTRLLRDFITFGDRDEGIVKIVAGYHQVHAVERAVEATRRAASPEGDRRIGVIWHTQGSGKSLLMAFYAGRVARDAAMANPTLVVVTDRNDLDDQLFATFSAHADLLRQTPERAEGRADLRRRLAREAGGIVFTTMQKFALGEDDDTHPELTARRNVVVIADEAHRSHYGFGARLDRETGGMSYGFAKHLRDALPGAAFIGFTGTPIEAADVNTPAVFGDYIDVYDIARAVADGATVPIYYESRLARIDIPEDEKPAIDEEVAGLIEDETADVGERLKSRWATVEALIGAEKRIDLVAADLVEHLENRLAALDGKAMAVCASRRICVALHDAIVRLRPGWHSGADDEGLVKVVMTGTASDPPAWREHLGKGNGKPRRDLIAKRARRVNDPLRLVIVRDMWLTGFDAPCIHTMYVDKPMRGHGLMQAIARVNRRFRDKPAGLVVDYIGVAQRLKAALQDYAPGDREQIKTDENAPEFIAVFVEKLDIIRAMFHGFDLTHFLSGKPGERLACLAEAMAWVLDMQQRDAARETTPEAKARARRRFDDAVLALSKAFALAAASEEAKAAREEVAFYQAVRIALAKNAPASGLSKADRELAVQQIVSRAVVSTEIVDILRAAGITTPDISVLSEAFLAEVAGMDRKNLALEALRKLLDGEVRARAGSNVVQAQAFSARLDDAMARYHSNAITTAEVLQRLIELAREISAARSRGEEQGLSPPEVAFYDALAQNRSAVEALGDDALRVIAQELLTSLRGNVTVDWSRRESARARLRVLVKRILRRHGYPPDLQDEAVRVVLRQAEALLTLEAA